MPVFLTMMVVGILGTVGIAWTRHLRALRGHRGLSRSEFVSHFAALDISPKVAGAAYEHFKGLGVWKGFVPSPADTLEGTYRIVDEDVEDALTDIVRGLGWEMPHSGVLLRWETPVETLDQAVRWLDWVGRQQANPQVVSPHSLG